MSTSAHLHCYSSILSIRSMSVQHMPNTCTYYGVVVRHKNHINNCNNNMIDNSTNLILKKLVEKLRNIGNINFAFCPNFSNNTSKTQCVKSLNNPDKSIVYEIKCRNYSNKNYTCEKYSWKRKEIFDFSRKLKRHQKSIVHFQEENEANEFSKCYLTW